MPINFIVKEDAKLDPEYKGMQRYVAPPIDPPRTVAQQARHLEMPYAKGVMYEACEACASHKQVVWFHTRWRHTFRICEECLDKFHELLIRTDS